MYRRSVPPGRAFPALLLSLSLAACGGGGGSGSGSDGGTATERADPAVTVGFPSPNANLAGPETTTTVRGRVLDANGGAIRAGDVSFVDVNSNFATFDVGDPTRWSVEVPVGEGATTLDVTMELADGSTRRRSQLVFNQARFSWPSQLVYDAVNERVLATDLDLDSLMLADLATGGLSILSDGSTVAPLFHTPIGLAYDAPNNRALVVDFVLDYLVSVDLATGTRTIISDNSGTKGTGPSFAGPILVGYDAVNNPGKAMVYDRDNESLFEVDLSNGNRQVLSASGDGNGPDLDIVEGFHYDGANDRVLLSVSNLTDELFAINVDTGARTVISSAGKGSGENFFAPGGVTYDDDNDRALVIDYARDILFGVDMTTGDREILSDNTVAYTGVEISEAFHLVYDGDNNRVLYTDRDPDAIIELDLATGNRTLLIDGRTSTGTGFSDPYGAVLDVANNRVLVADQDAAAVVAVDLDSGNRETLSAAGSVGSGFSFGDPIGIGYDNDNDRALITDSSYEGLFVVDLATGDRELVTENGDGNGADFIMNPVAVAYAAATGSAIVADRGNTGFTGTDADALLFRVNLATGAREILSDNSGAYAGPDFVEPTGIALDEAGGRAFVVEAADPPALIEVDLDTGERSTVADNSGAYGGPDFGGPLGVVYDRENDRVLVLDNSLKSVLAVDPGTGNRTVLSDDNDPGPDFGIVWGMTGGDGQDRVFVTDRTNTALLIVDLPSGARAIASR